MKRIITTIFIIAIFLPTSSAFAVEIGGGLKGGLNVTWLHGSDADDATTKTGFCVGGFASFGLGNAIVIQPEILYSQNGTRWTGHNPYYGSIEATVKLDYLTIPLIFKYIMPAPGTIKPNLYIGPYFATNLSSVGKIQVGGVFVEEDIEGVKSSDYGLVLGGGINFGLRTGGKVVFDVRYLLGLTTIDEEGYDLKNDVVSIMLGYSF